jgi:hypothetical protein
MKSFKDIPPVGLSIAQVLAEDPGGTLYTFVEGHSMHPTHIASGVLVKLLTGRFPIHKPEISPSLARALERGDLGVEEPHALKLPEAALDTPVTVCEWGDTHIIADGAHRLWRRWKRGDKTFPAYIVPEKLWRHFVVNGVPGTGEFWDTFNRTAQIRTPEMERLLKLLGAL